MLLAVAILFGVSHWPTKRYALPSVSELIAATGGPSVARCVHCGALAVGPCARCRAPLCGDCCVMTEGGVKVWAICRSCDARMGHSLGEGWAKVIGWIFAPLLGLIAILALLVWWTRG